MPAKIPRTVNSIKDSLRIEEWEDGYEAKDTWFVLRAAKHFEPAWLWKHPRWARLSGDPFGQSFQRVQKVRNLLSPEKLPVQF